MRHIQFLAIAGAIAILSTTMNTANAGGSWGGSSGGAVASAGGASSGGGGLLSRLRARHSGGSHGSSGGSGSSGGGYTVHHVSSGSSGGSSGGRVGPLRRLMAKLHSHRASRGSSGGSSSHGGSSGGGHGSSGGGSAHASYSGGSSGGGSSHSVSHGAAVHSVSLGASSHYESPVIQSSYQSYESPVIHSTPMDSGPSIINSVPLEGSSLEGGSLGTETIIDAAQYESAKPAVETPEIDPDAAMLTVAVPDDAVVTVNGHPTTSDGDLRQFMSRGLKDGYVYTYVVKVTYEKDGEAKTESKSVKLRRGDIERLQFEAPSVKDEPAQPAEPAVDDVVTVVRIRVPADAEVTLAGNPTAGSGAIRTFRTKQLKSGQQWTGYTVRVTSLVNGQKVSKERTIDVLAGSTNDLSFNFDSSSVASAR